MYYYVYDEFIQDSKFERELAQIETRLTDLGIAGKIARLALFRDPAELIRDEIRKGAKTVVAVGNDLTLRKIIDAAAESEVAIAVIPLGGTQHNRIAHILGVPSGVAACEVLSGRIIEKMDSGVVNGKRFLNSCTIDFGDAADVVCDQQFTLKLTKKQPLEIRNLALADEDVPAADPTDGRVELVVRAGRRSWFGKKNVASTRVPVQEARIKTHQQSKISIDGEEFQAKEFHVSVIPGHLRVITGKGRKF